MHNVTLTSADDVSAFAAALGVEDVSCLQNADETWTVSVPDASAAAADAVIGSMPAARAARLKAYAASVRYNKETGGITWNSAPIKTDRESQALITGLRGYAQDNPTATINFVQDGAYFSLTADQAIALFAAVSSHVQSCRNVEVTVAQGIDAGTTTTRDQVDAAFA